MFENKTPIQTFYTGKVIFLTGFTGFLGKTIVEKLLRACPDLKMIYVLVRQKRGKQVQERVNQLLEDPLFDKLREIYPKFKQKITPVTGDIGLPGLGLNQKDLEVLIDEVNVIIHGAATVRFNEPLKTAVILNVSGVLEILKFTKKIKNLKSMVHISTAYSQNERITDEIFYRTPIDHHKLITLAETLDDEFLDEITPKIIGEFPNTYSFTKAVSEYLVKQEGSYLPISVFRPSIVVSTYKEPIKGWVDNFYGPVGLTVGVANGLIRVIQTKKNYVINMVPVDMCANAIIVQTYYTSEQFEKFKAENLPYEIPISNYESDTYCPITNEKFIEYCSKYGLESPSTKAIWYYFVLFVESDLGFFLGHLLLHIFPALLIDGVIFCLGKKPRMLDLYNSKINKLLEVLKKYSMKDWKFHSRNIQKMISNLDPRDRTLFFCDLKKLNWEEFFVNFSHGLRLYLLKESDLTLELARERYRKFWWAHQFLKVAFLCIFFYFFWFILTSLYYLIGKKK